MYESIESLNCGELGNVIASSRLEDSGDSSFSLRTNIGSASEAVSSISIPNGALNVVYEAIRKLRDTELRRKGLPITDDDGYDEFDDEN